MPIHVAKTLTYPEKVTQYNIRRMQSLVIFSSSLSIYIGSIYPSFQYESFFFFTNNLKKNFFFISLFLFNEKVINGPLIHPGANFVESVDGRKSFLMYTDRKAVARDLQVLYIEVVSIDEKLNSFLYFFF